MKKEFTRDYVTQIFRTWAAAGMPTYTKAREQVYNTELAKRVAMDAATAVMQADIAIEKRAPFLLDIMAAEKTLEILERGGKHAIAEAVKAVYCVRPLQSLQRGDIIDRVRHFSLTYPADERSVYRWLKEARLLCAAVRGLQISDEDARKYKGSPKSCQ